MSLNDEERRIVVRLQYNATESDIVPKIESTRQLIAKIEKYINSGQ